MITTLARCRSMSRWSIARWGRGLLCLSMGLAAAGAHASPGISFNPNPLGFGNGLVGQWSSPQTLTITNSGTSPLTVNSISFTGGNPSDFAISSDTGEATLGPGASRTLGIRFNAGATGSRSTSLTVSDNAAGSPQLLSLTGNGVTTFVNRSPRSVDFGDQYVYVKSAAQSVVIRNDWNTTLHLNGAVISGPNKADFTADTSNCTNVSLVPGGTCSVPLTFTPGALGGRSATLYIYDDAPYSPHLVSLSGKGILNPTLLNAPSNLTATVSDTVYPIHLAWTDNSNNETGFALQVQIVGQSTWTDVGGFPANSTSGDLGSTWTRGRAYNLRVRAVNATGASPWSNQATADLTFPPHAPYNLTATGVASGIKLSWTDNNSPPVNSFEIWRKKPGTDWTLIKTISSDFRSFTNFGMTPGVVYTYRVRSIRKGLYSDWSNEASAMMVASP